MTQDTKALTDPERIFLEPECCSDPREGRMYSETNEWPLDDECEATGTEYVRADLVRTPDGEATDAKALLEGVTPDESWICASHPSSIVGWPIVSNTGRSLASLTYVPKEFPDAEAVNAQSYRFGKLMAAAPDLARQVITLTTRAETAEAEVKRLREAGDEVADKLWVLRCNSRDEADRLAAARAFDMWKRALLKETGE